MIRKWGEKEYNKPNFNFDELMKKATIVYSEETLKDIEPFEWIQRYLCYSKLKCL